MNHPAKILLVEDDSVILKATCLTLVSAGYEVSAAVAGAEGLRLAVMQPPDLALVDRVLPDMDGVEVCRRLKTNPATARVFVALMSGIKISGDDRADGLETGADDYIVRPVSNRELLARVQALLRIKKAEDALRESEDKFKYVFDYSSIGKSITLPSGEINVNQAFCDMIGYTQEELQNQKWQDITHPDDLEPTQRAVNALLSGEQDSARFSKRYIHKNGSIVWTELSTSLRRDETGKPLYFMTTISDITARQQAEEALRESERKLREAQELAHLGFWRWDVKTGDVEWSEEVFKIFGLDPQEFTPHIDSILAFSPWPEDHQRDKELINRALETHSPGHYEQKFLRPDQSIGYYYSTFQGNYAENGDPLSIVGTVLDITERVRTEETLHESEERFRSLYTNSTVGLYRTTPDGRILLANPTLSKMLGYASFDGLAARDLAQGGFESSRDRVQFLEAIERDGVVKGWESGWTRRDGMTIFVRESARAIRDPQGKTLYYDGTVEDITARKRAEEALIASEVRYRRLFEAARDGILILDAETGVIVDANPFLGELLGYSSATFLGQKVWELGFFKDIAANEVKFLELQQKKYARYEHLPLETADGRRIDVEFVSNVYLVDHKKVVQCNIRDITERKRQEAQTLAAQAELQRLWAEAEQSRRALLSVVEDHRRTEEALAVERSLLRTLVEHLPDAVYVKDAAGRKTLSNPADFHNMGADSEAEVLGKTDFELFPRDLAEAFYADDQHVLQTGQPILNREEGITRSDGTRGRQLTSKIPVRDGAGQVIGLVGIGHDITERKQAEEIVRWAGQRYRSLFEEAPLMYIITRSQEGGPIIADCNRAFTDTLGYTRDEVIGRPLADLYTPESRAALLEGGYQQAMGDGVGVEERRLVARDGHVIEIILTALPETDTQGHVTGTRAMFVDVTERKRAEEVIKAYSEKLEQRVAERTRSLEEAQERLLRQERLTVLGQVAGGIAHDLRTPLGAIKNAAYLLNLLCESPDAEVKEALDILDQEVNTSDRIITSLLNFTRPQRPAWQVVKVDQVIEHALRRVHMPPNVQIERRIADVPTILADAGQLEQVFDNLILNAVQAMPDGGRLVIQAQPASTFPTSVDAGFMPVSQDNAEVAGWIVVSIADSGTGITPEHLARLFEPLFTTKSTGMGLGLALVKLLTQANGGGIAVHSEPGKGSTFNVYLPVAKE